MKNICILVVDDHADTLEMLARLLKVSGYRVKTAATFEAAVSLADCRECDLMIADIGLPGRSGLDLMRELKGKYGLKGIAVSGYASEEDKRLALEAGFDRYLRKPIDLPDLLAAIMEIA